MVFIGNDWDEIIAEDIKSKNYLALREFLKQEYSSRTVFPEMHDIFNALKYTPFSSVKVVILGQDPYHEKGQAHGLAFSVQPGIPTPPSLLNIYRELQSDIGFTPPSHGCLKAWAERGVLLLNTVLTVREGCANSHRDRGWETFTDALISHLNERVEPMVFMLWGANARMKAKLITSQKHLILTAPHPSPLSAYSGFFGCRHFSKANDFLIKNGQEPIDWSL